jgi:O-antigen/teichoic acid export membrane protein
MTTRPSADNTRTITRNSFWYALDASAATLVMILASVPVARVLGPEVLGHYIFLLFLTTIGQRLANVGIPATGCNNRSSSWCRIWWC